MDVTLLNENSLRIKGKNASIVVNPTKSTSKTEADAIVRLGDNPDFNTDKIEGSRITIVGPGDYEVGGIKISTTKVDEEQVARIDVDNVKLLVGSGKSIEKIHDKVEEAQLVVINSDAEFNHSVLTSLEPNVLVVYGTKKTEVAKSLGKDTPTITNKYSTASDKLPQEMELVLLD